jgi:hypothetical protein
MPGVMAQAAAAAAPEPRTVRLGGTAYPLILPSLGDPRLHLAAIIVSLQVLGQAVLGFELSVAQILVTVGTCALLDAAIAFHRQRVLMWPASALLSGNGVAFILRTVGTRHGDWWSLQGIHVFLVAAAVSVLSKHLLRHRGAHVFNPSNLGLLAAFVLLGTARANPQDLWWGELSPGLAVTLAIIVAGGLAMAWRLGMLGMAVAFWTVLAACLGLLAATGHCMTARWHYGAVCGEQFWSSVATSPELLVFLFFMISDPRTAPRGRVARAVYGGGVALLSALLMAPQQTEFATKVALLAALVIACAAMPLLRHLLPDPGGPTDRTARWLATVLRRRGLLLPAACLAASGGLLLLLGLPGRSTPVAAADATLARLPAALSADLATARAALARRDPSLAATAATGPFLAALRRDIAAGAAPPAYQLTRATFELLRDPGNGQAPPRLGVSAQGSLDGRPFHGVFVLVADGDRYLVSEVVQGPEPLG